MQAHGMHREPRRNGSVTDGSQRAIFDLSRLLRPIDQAGPVDKIVVRDTIYDMRWFRNHIGHGSWLALIALAINFTLAFGHVHALDGGGSEHPLVLALGAGDSGQSQDHPANHPDDYLCPICMAVAIMGNALASTPPAALPIELAEVRIDRPVDHMLSAPRSPRASFQSRAPPIS